MKHYSIAFACLALACGVGSAASAADNTVATLTAVKGDLEINQGVEFVPGKVDDKLVAGDRVMAVRRDSAGEVTFNDGCKLKVEPRTVVTIADSKNCKGGFALVQSTNPGETGALGGGSVGAAPFVLVIAGLAVGGYVVAHNANASNNPPLSP
jgi:hypothetical protein